MYNVFTVRWEADRFLLNVKSRASWPPPLAAWLRPPPPRQPATRSPTTTTVNFTVNTNTKITRSYTRGVPRTPTQATNRDSSRVTLPTARYLHLRGSPAAVPSNNFTCLSLHALEVPQVRPRQLMLLGLCPCRCPGQWRGYRRPAPAATDLRLRRDPAPCSRPYLRLCSKTEAYDQVQQVTTSPTPPPLTPGRA